MVDIIAKTWSDSDYIYVEVGKPINGILTAYAKQFPIGFNLQDAKDLCWLEFEQQFGETA